MAHAPQQDQTLLGPLFREPMRVVTVQANGTQRWVLGLVGTNTSQFRQVNLTGDDLAQLTVLPTGPSYTGDPARLRLGLQAHALGIAFEFDPYFGLSISRVDPPPHQLEAVYDHLLKQPRVRFLLADDAGAGKTIMAGLLLRELKLRGLLGRILIICPANLIFQWQCELKEKFDETFAVLHGTDIREQYGINQWLERPQVITSPDLAKRDDVLPGLRQVHWDMVIVDEAHRMSWTPQSRKTARYALGELPRDIRLTPNEKRVAEDRRDRYWLYVVTACATTPVLFEQRKNPATIDWPEVTSVAHYYVTADTLQRPMGLSDRSQAPFAGAP